MMADFRQLHYFITLAETRNFGRAAGLLNITQPPLSRQIAALEERLGVTLFERHHLGVTLTLAGEGFYQDAKAIISAYQQACRNAQQTAKGERGTLSVGFMMHAAWTTIPELTRRMVTDYPQVKLLLHEATPGVLLQAVLDGEYDAGVTFQSNETVRVNSLPLRQERLCLAVNRHHPLAGRQQIVAADLRNEPLIVTPQAVAPVLRETIDIFLRSNGVEPYYRLETHLQQTIVSFVAEGLGSALVPESVKKLNYADVEYRAIAQSPTIVQVLVWRKDNHNPALASFVSLTQALLSEGNTGIA
ncbi:LysR family transcriptional regulator [Phytobacter sp. V91]|uniref:LysR family transcriptional regulator n=1 Tax=Phytobacter sp. V91 TaxID=3369425 RepID=UPI003F6419E0